VSRGIQVIGKILEFLRITVCLAPAFNNLFLVFLGNIIQSHPHTMDLGYLPGCAEEDSGGCLLGAGMTTQDDQLNPGKSSFFEVLEQSRPERFVLALCDSRS